MITEEYVEFALGAKPFGDHFKDEYGDHIYIVGSKFDIKKVKESNQDKDFGYFKINRLSPKDFEFGYLPEAIVIDNESDIKFDSFSIIVMMVM